jgi:ankyrin repeat protein
MPAAISLWLILIKAEAHVNRLICRTAALMDAAFYGHIPVVDLLIKADAHVNLGSSDGRTVLRAALAPL